MDRLVGVPRDLRSAVCWNLANDATSLALAFVHCGSCGLGRARSSASFIITGYAASQLGHSQAHLPILIQIADQLGGYGVSFVLMTVAVAVFQAFEGYRHRGLRTAAPALVASVVLLVATLAYGKWRLDQADALARSAKPLLSVVLLQENTPRSLILTNDVSFRLGDDTTISRVRQDSSMALQICSSGPNRPSQQACLGRR